MSSSEVHAWAALEKGGLLQPHVFSFDKPLGETEIEIKVEVCGLCYSDLSIINNEWECSEYPVVPGHEIVGTVVAMGGKVSGGSSLAVGDRVGCGWHSGFCGACRSCKEADPNLCKNATATIISHSGGFADLFRCEAAAAIKIPETLPSAVAAPLLCAGVTVYNPLVQFNIQPHHSVAIVGIGGLGHLALQYYSKHGCHVTAFTSNPDSKREEAVSFGAKEVLSTKLLDAYLDKKASAEGVGEGGHCIRDKYDLILSTVTVCLDWAKFVEALAPRGRLHFCGSFAENISVPLEPLLVGQKCISATQVGSPDTIRKALEFAAEHGISPQLERYELKDCNEAISKLTSGEVRYRAVINIGGK